MKRALVHIGAPKTGTTSIQKYLKSVDLGGISYPILRGVNQNVLSMVYREPENWFPWVRHWFGTLSLENKKILRNAYKEGFLSAASISDEIIISSEMMLYYADDNIKAFKADLLDAGFQQIHIILYLRNPADHYLSGVQQQIKISESFHLPEAKSKGITAGLKRWMGNFPGTVHVKAYNPEIFPQGDVVADFVRFTNNYFGSSISEPARQIRRNVSLSVEEMALLLQYRQDTETDVSLSNHPKYQLLTSTMKRLVRQRNLELNRPMLKQELRKYILSNSTEMNSFLDETFKIRLPDCETDGMPVEKPDIDVESIASITTNYDMRKHIFLQNLIIDELLKQITTPQPKVGYFRRAMGLVRRLLLKALQHCR